MRKDKTSVLGALLGILLVLSAIFAYTNFIKPRSAKAPTVSTNNSSFTSSTPSENSTNTLTNTLLNTITSHSSHSKVTLSDVSSGNSTGIAYILRDDTLYHVVNASLPNPGENSYEGWLVNSSGDSFSTGIMQKTTSGWTLEYTNNNLYEGYNKIVITLETIVDSTPETHILEASF